MPTEFICKIRESGGDYSSLASWEDAIDCDLTASSTKVFSGTLTGTISDGASVTLYRGGSSQGVTATVLHVTISGQIGLISISNPSFSFQSGDEWRVDSSNYFTISNSGDSMIAVAEIDGTWSSADTTVVTLSGWTTSTNNYIYIRAVGNGRHGGKWNTSKYRLQVNPSDGAVFAIHNEAGSVTIQGIQIYQNGTGQYDYAICTKSTPSGSHRVVVSDCLIRSNTGSGRIGIQFDINYGSVTGFVYNNIIYDMLGSHPANRGINSGGAYIVYAYNNTVVDCYYGIYSQTSNLLAKNNIVKGGTYRFYGTFVSGSDYNAADNSDTTGGPHDRTNQTFSFVDESSDDFHLASNDIGARNCGTDLSSDAYLAFSVDIDGETRPGEGYWDIGADEYVPVSAGYTLECLSGAISLSGNLAQVLFNRLLSASVGSVSLNGFASSLLFNRLVSALAGSVSVDGSPSSVLFDRQLSATAGSIHLSGSQAGLAYNRVLVPSAGEVVIVGQPATLTYTQIGIYTLLCLGGAVELDGNPLILLADRILVPSQGAVILTGNSSNLGLSRRVVAESGQVSLQGSAATVLFDRLLGAQGGALEVSGSAAWANYDRLLSAIQGQLGVSGNQAELYLLRLIQVLGGQIHLVGSTAVLSWSGQPVLPIFKSGWIISLTPRFLVSRFRPRYNVRRTK